MNKRKQILVLAVLLVGAAAAYFGRAAWRAHSNLVSLNVRNMEVREVVRKLERQTWESIYVDRNVQGKVTIRVDGVPLEEVLRTIGDQTMARPLVLYAVYSGGSSLAKLEQAVRGEVDPATHGWTNLPSAFRGGPMGGPGPMMIAFGPGANPFGAMPDSNQRVSLTFAAKELSFVTTAFNRFAQTRIVPEDGAGGLVTLSLHKVPVEKAVAQVAGKVHRSSKKIYALQGMRGPGGPGGPGPAVQMVRFDDRGPMTMQRGPGSPPEMTDQQRDEMRQKREALEQDLRSALPTEERQKLEQQQAEQQKQMQEMANMTPEERRTRMEQMMRANGGGNMDKMNRQRVLNTTPEQRAEMTRREKEMRAQFGQAGFGQGGTRQARPQ